MSTNEEAKMQPLETILHPSPLELISLGPPEANLGHIETDDEATILQVAEAHFSLWESLLTNSIDFGEPPIVYYCTTCTNPHTIDRHEALLRAVMTAGSYYTYCTHFLATMRTVDEIIPGASVDELVRVRNMSVKDIEVEWSRELLEYFIGVLQAAQVVFQLRIGSFQSESLIDDFERILVNSVLGVFHVYQKNVDSSGLCAHGINAQFLMRRALTFAIHLLDTVYAKPARPWSKAHALGPFSALRLPELQLLAERNGRVLAKYGAKETEKIFEQQLALLTQSLGFYVVATRNGERTVDLICISGGPSASYTFMLEAKTSGHSYALPTKDERALIDYIQETKQRLTTSPPLAYVLIIGPGAAKSLEAKLRQVEAKTQTPVRFCRAQDIALFRENLVGPLPLGILKDAIVSGSYILEESVFTRVVEEVNLRRDAQATLVRTFMSVSSR